MAAQLKETSGTTVLIGLAEESNRFHAPRPLAFLLALILHCAQTVRGRAEDTVAYRYEDYQEDGGRVRVHTQAAHFETDFSPRVAVKGDFVYDAISGATPTGALPPIGSTQVPLVALHDQRFAGNLGTDFKFGRTTTTPQLAYSTESDYRSVGLSLNEAVDFNERNTTLNLGVAHNFDRVNGFFQRDWRSKGSTDFLVGVNQLLGPHTYVTANVTLGYADGYLTDPYKGVAFQFHYSDAFSYLDPDPTYAVPERRPSHKFRQVGFVGLTHFFETLQGSLETSYRFHHDDWGIFSHTVELSWHQKLGRKLTLSPLFRFYNQTAATFYAPSFKGDFIFADGATVAVQSGGFYLTSDDPGFPGDAAGTLTVPAHPNYFSADYRLSELNTFTYGISASWRVHDHFSIEAAYKRYEMLGLDGVTSPSAYPKAHIFTIGFGLWF